MSFRYGFTTLTSALRDRRSPLRVYLDDRFGNIGAVQAEHRRHRQPLRVASGTADAGVVGAAFELALRYRFRATVDSTSYLFADARDQAAWTPILDRLPAPQDAAEMPPLDVLWLAGLRRQIEYGGAPRAFDALRARGAYTSADVERLVDDDGIDQVAALLDLAVPVLDPLLVGERARAEVTFDGSRHCRAIADFIAGSTLLEVKTKVGKHPRADGTRVDRLELDQIFQPLCYALFDHSDTYGIDTLALYSARYAALTTWDLVDLATTLAGGPVDLAHERDTVRSILDAHGMR